MSGGITQTLAPLVDLSGHAFQIVVDYSADIHASLVTHHPTQPVYKSAVFEAAGLSEMKRS